MKKSIILIAFLILGISCKSDNLYIYQKGIQNLSIQVDGIEREFILYLPENMKRNAPLVLSCHGFTDNANSFMNYTKMNQVADEHGFAVCYPQGTKDKDGKNFWQVGYTFHQNENVDDIKFITQLVKYLQDEYELSQENTFITGMSNGGDLCNLLACKTDHIFKAYAPVVGCMMEWFYDAYESTSPKPTLMMNGTADNTTTWDGDVTNQQGWGSYSPTLKMRDFWIKKNDCAGKTIVDIPNTNTNDGSSVVLEKYIDGLNGNQVWFYKVVNGGHDWPGGSGNKDINASEEIWKFFKLFIDK